MWILDHLDDIASDLSAIHRVDDMWSMPAGRFVRLAERLWHYPGAMRDRVLARYAAEGPRPDPQVTVSAPPGVGVAVESTREALDAHGGFSDLIDWG